MNCEKCGHQWWIGRDSTLPDLCFVCARYGIEDEDLCPYCDRERDVCDCNGPESYDDNDYMDDYDYTDDERRGTEKTCEKCQHTWWIGRDSKDPDTCFECLRNEAYEEMETEESYHEEFCQYCGPGTFCDGCCGDDHCEGCNQCCRG